MLSALPVMATYDVPLAIVHFIAVEFMTEVLMVLPIATLSTVGMRTMVSVTIVKAIIDVPAEMRPAMVPGSCSNKDAVREPSGAVVAVRRTRIRRIVVIAVGAYWRRTDLNGDLSMRFGRADEKETTCDCQHREVFQQAHDSYLGLVGVRAEGQRLCGPSRATVSRSGCASYILEGILAGAGSVQPCKSPVAEL